MKRPVSQPSLVSAAALSLGLGLSAPCVADDADAIARSLQDPLANISAIITDNTFNLDRFLRLERLIGQPMDCSRWPPRRPRLLLGRRIRSQALAWRLQPRGAIRGCRRMAGEVRYLGRPSQMIRIAALRAQEHFSPGTHQS